MRIPIPRPIVRVWDRFVDWGNEKTLGILRVDILIGLSFVGSVGWTLYASGWFAALQAAALFVFILICCLWVF